MVSCNLLGSGLIDSSGEQNVMAPPNVGFAGQNVQVIIQPCNSLLGTEVLLVDTFHV